MIISLAEAIALLTLHEYSSFKNLQLGGNSLLHIITDGIREENAIEVILISMDGVKFQIKLFIRRLSMRSSIGWSLVISQVTAICLISPIFPPSGDSNGQINPNCSVPNL